MQTVSKASKYLNQAIVVSIFSVFYNIAEGAVSIYFGEVSDSISLFFFGVQSGIEVISSIIVLWKIKSQREQELVEVERKATKIIGVLFIFLALGTAGDGIRGIIQHDHPNTTISGMIISSVATVIMFTMWQVKKKLATILNSSTISSDAKCSLACIQLTVLVFLGSGTYHFWPEFWWADSSVSIALSILFMKEGINMLNWAYSQKFTGGCCGGCGDTGIQNEDLIKRLKQGCCDAEANGKCCSKPSENSCNEEKCKGDSDCQTQCGNGGSSSTKCCSEEKNLQKNETCCGAKTDCDSKNCCGSEKEGQDNVESQEKLAGCSDKKD